jgi:lipoprotein signal peptidase
MAHSRKLKTDKSVTGLLPAIMALTILILTSIFWGLVIAFKVLAGILLIYAFFQYFAFSKVRSLSYFLSATYILSASLFLYFIPVSERGIAKGEFSTVAKFLTFTTVFLLLWLLYLMITRKTKWKGREVFELAAMPVNETSDGFTERPRPTGKISYSKHDLLAYADFLRKNQIALPFVEEDKVVLVPVIMSKEFSLLYRFRINYHDRSWVAFTFNGDVSVHISKKDYLEYKDQLSFDRLCESMGDLFKEFLDMFLKNEGVRIIDRLDSLKVSIFS